MDPLSKAQRARTAIAAFKTLADAVILRGSYQPSGMTGSKLEHALRQFCPEIYGSMADPRIVELKGLEYVIDRLPPGIERCLRIVLTAQEDLADTTFRKISPRKRRRRSYVVSEDEICFVITRGTTEIYDLLTHLTFLHIEAQKIHEQACLPEREPYLQWLDLGSMMDRDEEPQGGELDKALWGLATILGRTYRETRDTYEYLETGRREGYNNGLFRIINALGNRIVCEKRDPDKRLTISFTPALQEILGHHRYATVWSEAIMARVAEAGLLHRPMHVISANLHSVKNVLYGAGALEEAGLAVPEELAEMIQVIRERDIDVAGYAEGYGFVGQRDRSGSNIDVQIIDTGRIDSACPHPSVALDFDLIGARRPVLIVIDYAFGAQAYEILDELLSPTRLGPDLLSLRVKSISVMGKAGILGGQKGDIMLATAHVMEGTTHNYIVDNDLDEGDFAGLIPVFSGPMVTVLGTSLQNRDVLERFHTSSWRAIGLEMEGGHYQRAINAAIIQGHISAGMKVRYAYYASDNPLVSGQTLASGPMGAEGVYPTYLITKIILEKIFAADEA